jgi:hypothetical protein
MQLSLTPDRVQSFESGMADLAPWMHAYKFSNEILTGLYKNEGFPSNLSFCNSRSSREDIERMNRAYNLRNHELFPQYFSKIMRAMDLGDRSQITLLDLASATGKNSMLAVEEGFGRVIASEIRPNQCEQQKLIYECLADRRYSERITVHNDTISADSPDFADLYVGKKIDVVLSFGLLYHLVNPYQHLVNLREIAGKYAVIYTQTHMAPYREFLWKLKIEDRKWVTKAAESVSWVAHHLEIIRLCKMAGFRSVKIVYPDIFEKYYKPDPERYDPKVIRCQNILARFGIKIGYRKISDFEFFRYTNLSPEYFTFVCEK